MRILFDSAIHDFRNKGNNILLQTAIERIARFFPEADLEMLAVAPRLGRLYFPNVRPVNPDDLSPIHGRLDALYKLVPAPIWWLILELREAVWHQWPQLAPNRLRLRLAQFLRRKKNASTGDSIAALAPESNGGSQAQPSVPDLDGMRRYDLVVFTGGQYICDSEYGVLLNIFNRIEAAVSRGIPVVMVGQGVGPLADRHLLARAKQILPRVNLICARNKPIGLPLLAACQVPPERICWTGDDAVEPAFQARPHTLGTAIGISLRVASYTQLEQRHIWLLRTVLHQVAGDLQAQLVGIPTSSATHESDATFLKQVLSGYRNVALSRRKLDTAADAIRQIGRCRVMVSGTYHGAVFALAQGIPVIGIAHSAEYFDKLSELTDEFGTAACRVFQLEEESFEKKFTTALCDVWDAAEQLAPALAEAAVYQIQRQHAAYQKIHDLVIQTMEAKR